MRNRTSDYGAARVCKGINLGGREANNTVPNILPLLKEERPRDFKLWKKKHVKGKRISWYCLTVQFNTCMDKR